VDRAGRMRIPEPKFLRRLIGNDAA
jgi:hypothetical protein